MIGSFLSQSPTTELILTINIFKDNIQNLETTETLSDHQYKMKPHLQIIFYSAFELVSRSNFQ